MRDINKRHPHADVIIAWANGEDIQWLSNGKWETLSPNEMAPSFYPSLQYRVKPKTKVIKFRLYRYHLNSNIGLSLQTEEDYLVNPCDKCEETYRFLQWVGDWQEVEIPAE